MFNNLYSFAVQMMIRMSCCACGEEETGMETIRNIIYQHSNPGRFGLSWGELKELKKERLF